MFLHYSFDLWMTLIRSNPQFKHERALYFQKNFNPLNKSLDEVKQIIKSVDDMCNAINEAVGKNVDALEMYAMVLNNLGNNISDFSNEDLERIYADTEILFLTYHPTPYSPDTIFALEKIANKATVSIISNTGFIKGKTVLKWLKVSEFKNIPFSYIVFSDQAGMSKPNRKLFKSIYRDIPCSKDQIVHVGDNPNADVWGARSVGVQSILINHPDSEITIIDLI